MIRKGFNMTGLKDVEKIKSNLIGQEITFNEQDVFYTDVYEYSGLGIENICKMTTGEIVGVDIALGTFLIRNEDCTCGDGSCYHEYDYMDLVCETDIDEIIDVLLCEYKCNNV